MDKTIRLQKYLADRGVASRRASEQLIRDGRVSINGRVAELGESVRPGDKVSLDGKPVRSEIRRPTYFILYKPRGVVTTLSDELGRKCVRDLISSVSARVFPVGRLDKDSEGMLLFTDDGELANRLTSAAAHVPKTYRVTVRGNCSAEILQRMKEGMSLSSGEELLPCDISVRERDEDRTVLHITLYEGKNRQIRRMFEEFGLSVTLLKRESIGDLRLGDIKTGEIRYLTEDEITYLKSL